MRMTLFWALAATAIMPFAAPAGAASITLTCGSVGVEQALCQNAVSQWEAMTGHEVEVYASPMSSADPSVSRGRTRSSTSDGQPWLAM